MNKINFEKFFKESQFLLSKYSPEILTGIGIAGMVTSTILAVKATPKAVDLIENLRKEQWQNISAKQANELNKNGVVELPPITKIDIVKVTWKGYIPAVSTSIVSIACLIGANSVNNRRNAALATAFKISETALREYKNKVIETIGEEKERVLSSKIDEDKIRNNPIDSSQVYLTEKGNVLCYDSMSGRYFKSDINVIESAVNKVNKQMLTEMYISLNDFYSELGLKGTYVGDDLGWNVDDGLLRINFGSQIADDGTPCVVINYNVEPKYDFAKGL